MRRLVALGAALALAWRLVARRRDTTPSRVVVCYTDGSSVTLEPGSPERELLLDAARQALQT